MKKNKLILKIALMCLMICAVLIGATGCIGFFTLGQSAVLTAMADPTGDYGNVFGTGGVIEVRLDIPASEWTALGAAEAADEYHKADITVNGVALYEVGIAADIATSTGEDGKLVVQSRGFKVKTDEFVSGQTLKGLDMFVLGGYSDSSEYMREMLAYAACASIGGMTPYVAYANLYVNNSLCGFYIMVEGYEDGFAERNRFSPDTVLYSADGSCTLLLSDDGSGFSVELGQDDERANILKLIEALDALTPENKRSLESILDVDSVLRGIALDFVTGNPNGYAAAASDYYLLYSSGEFTYIGGDYSMSFGGNDLQNEINIDLSGVSQRLLVEKLLEIPEYYEKYIGYVESLVIYFGNLERTVSGIESVIRTDVSRGIAANRLSVSRGTTVESESAHIGVTDETTAASGTDVIVNYMKQRLGAISAQLSGGATDTVLDESYGGVNTNDIITEPQQDDSAAAPDTEDSASDTVQDDLVTDKSH